MVNPPFNVASCNTRVAELYPASNWTVCSTFSAALQYLKPNTIVPCIPSLVPSDTTGRTLSTTQQPASTSPSIQPMAVQLLHSDVSYGNGCSPAPMQATQRWVPVMPPAWVAKTSRRYAKPNVCSSTVSAKQPATAICSTATCCSCCCRC